MTEAQLRERIAVLEATLRGVRRMLEVPVCGFSDVVGIIDCALAKPKSQLAAPSH